MNHPGEIRPLTRMVRPHVAIITLIAPAHLGNFRNIDEIARAKAEIFEGLVPGGTALINRDDRALTSMLEKLAREAGVEKIASFGANRQATFGSSNAGSHAGCSCITAEIGGAGGGSQDLGSGRHIVQNTLAVLGAADIVGADLAKAALALASLKAESGRGWRRVLGHPGGRITLDRRELQCQSGFDACGASEFCNRRSRPAAVGGSPCSATCWNSAGSRLACMPASPHRAFEEPVPTWSFWAASTWSLLKKALPAEFHVEYAQTVDELLPLMHQGHPGRRRHHGEVVERHRVFQDRQGLIERVPAGRPHRTGRHEILRFGRPLDA